MIKYKAGDKIKVVATLKNLRGIGIKDINIKGKIGVVESTYIGGGGLTARFDGYSIWSFPNAYIDKVVE